MGKIELLKIANLVNEIYDHEISKREANKQLIIFLSEMENRPSENNTKALRLKNVRRSFWCKIGIHKLKYTEKYLRTAKVKCARENCNVEFIEGEPGRLYRC